MSSEPVYWVDGKQSSALPLPDRGLEFGDGLFETMLYRRGSIAFVEYHLQRLAQGLESLRFPDCISFVTTCLNTTLETLAEHSSGSVRLTVTRGQGPRGYAPPLDCRPRIVISFNPGEYDLARLPGPATTDVCTVRWSNNIALAGLKHLNRLEQVMASQERMVAGLDEMLMLDQRERVISTISGNLYGVFDGEIHTPVIDSAGIRGTRRELLIKRWSRALGLNVIERDIDLPSLMCASELFYSNSLVGLRPIISVGERTWSSHPVCQALYSIYCGELR
ncbi:MAG: aminodeoxychorismate lyase [Halioglobus sp.]